MKTEKIIKPSFSVIGKEGSSEEGTGFVQKLWAEANAHFSEVQSLAKRNAAGVPVGFWGAMTDFSRSFLPWEDGFSRGLYLAGVECEEDAEAPSGWVKWTLPGFEYLRLECEGGNTFSEGIHYLQQNAIPLAGAVQDFTNPADGKSFMLFPVRVL